MKDPEFWNDRRCFTDHPLHMTQSQIDNVCNIGLHTHEFYEINIILEGTGQHLIEKMCIPVSPGSVFVLPPGVLHCFHSESDLSVFNLLIKKEFLHRYREEVTAMPGFSRMFEIEPYLRQVCRENFFLQLSPMEMLPLTKELDTLLDYIPRNYYANHNAGVLDLIGKLCLRMEQKSDNNPANADIFQIMEYINTHLSEKITLGQLTKLAHMSAATFNRFFKKTTGMSPMEYVTVSRISMARKLLDENRLNKTEIAAECGFYDISHMNKCLKAVNLILE